MKRHSTDSLTALRPTPSMARIPGGSFARGLLMGGLLMTGLFIGCGSETEPTDQGKAEPAGDPTSDTSSEDNQTSSEPEKESETPPANPGDPQEGTGPELRPATRNAIQAHLQEGNRRLFFREFVEANEEFRQALAILPDEPKTPEIVQMKAYTHFMLGRVMAEPSSERDYALSVEHLEKARALGADTAEVAFLMARSLYHQDLYDKSLEEYTRLKQALPESPVSPGLVEVLVGEAMVFMRMGETDKAVEAFEGVEKSFDSLRLNLPIKPNGEQDPPPVELNIRVMMLKAEIAELQENWESEAEAYREVIRLDPESKDAHYRLSRNLLTRQNKPEEAAVEKEIHELLIEATDNISSKARADAEKQKRVFTRLRELMPTYYKSYARILRAYRLAGLHPQMVEEADEGIAAIPDEAVGAGFLKGELYKLKGDAYAEMGRVGVRKAFRIESLGKAKEAYLKSAALAPAFAAKSQELVSQIEQTIRNLDS